MPKYHLHYFNGRGRAEVSRLLFLAAGVDFEDKRYTMEEWPAHKEDMPFKQMPVLFIDGIDHPLTQSFAIQRYLAREFEMAGSDSLEVFRVEEVMELTTDIWIAMIGVVHEKDEERKAEKKKDFTETRCPAVLKNLETVLCRNNDGDGFFVGDKLTVADLQVFNTFDASLVKPIIDQFPKLKAHHSRVAEIPNIAAYLEKRPETPF